MKTAIAYLRVSTPRQMNTAIDIDPEGNSIATQREFAQRRADGLNAVIERTFVEPGNSAQTLEKRPVFRELVAYIRDHPEVAYVIIYMRSRAFRNFTDAAITKRQFAKVGVTLISAREDFGEGYMADAMEAITDVFNEMEVRRNADDIRAKMRYKALSGGTVTRAKIGYVNITDVLEGRKFNTVAQDPDRAPLIKLAFELCATGEYTMTQLAKVLTERGLRMRPQINRPAGPISAKYLPRVLSDQYYLGIITYKGVPYPGRHEPLVTRELFDRGQTVLAVRAAKTGERQRQHSHYLKSSSGAVVATTVASTSA